jgi:hypothetical protein
VRKSEAFCKIAKRNTEKSNLLLCPWYSLEETVEQCKATVAISSSHKTGVIETLWSQKIESYTKGCKKIQCFKKEQKNLTP